MPRNNKKYQPDALYRVRILESVLAALAPAKQPAYRKILAGDTAFAAAYKAADKDLPICSECGNNCRPIERKAFDEQPASSCCYAPIEQDAGAGYVTLGL